MIKIDYGQKYSGVPENEFENIKNLCYRLYDIALMDTVTSNEESEFIDVYNSLTHYLDNDLRYSFYPKPAMTVFKAMRSPQFQKSFQIDPIEAWSQVKCGALLLRGSLDYNVSEESQQIIFDALKQGGNTDVTNLILDKHNHHFQRCISGRPSEVQSIDESISKETLTIITNWILKNE